MDSDQVTNISNFKTYIGYDFQVDVQRVEWRGVMGYLLGFCFLIATVTYPYISSYSEYTLWMVIIFLVLALIFVANGSGCFDEVKRLKTAEYFDYLDSCGIVEEALFNASKSPEYSDESKKKITDYLDSRRPNWSIRHPELWSGAA